MKEVINIDFKTISGCKCEEVLKKMANYKIKFRDKLNINSELTFGLEIEFENAFLNEIKKEVLIKFSNWNVVEESSLKKYDNFGRTMGGEVVSPILTDSKNTWKTVRNLCKLLDDNNAYIWEKSGLHINLGSQIIKGEDWLKFLKIWVIYEDIIYRFAYGLMSKPRSNIYKYASPISQKIYPCIDDISDCFDILRQDKKWGLQLKNVKSMYYEDNNRIEIRCPNGSTNPIIIQNDINFFINLFLCVNTIDIDYLNYQIKKFKPKEIKEYEIINIDKALELANIIYNNNYDKLLFLKQYYKNNNYQISPKKRILENR